MLWDESGDELVLAGDSKLSFNDAAGGENIVASADGHLEINSGTTLDITAATTQVNASTLFDVNGDVDITGDVTVNSDNVTFTSANTDDPLITIKQTGNNTTSPRIYFVKDKGDAGADNDEIGKIQFIADNDAQEQISFVKQIATIADASDGTEGGKFQIQIASHDGELVDGLVLTDGSAEDEIDVTIASGTASTTTIAGNLGVGITPTSKIQLDGTAGAGDNSSSILFSVGGTAESYFGVANGTGNIITGSASGDSVIRNDGGKILFSTDSGSSAHMVLESNGRLGIGTGTDPYAILQTEQDVAGEATALALVNNNVDGSADAVCISFGLARNNGYLFGFKAIKWIKEQAWTTTASTVDAALTFSTVENETLGERMRIDSSGRVGIGGTPTLGKLDIGASDSGTYAYFDDGTNTLFQFSADTSSGIIQTQGTGFSSWKAQDFRASEFIFKPSNSEKMRINGTGVGIGVTPATPFEVSDGTERYRIDFGTDVVYLMARNASAYIEAEYIATIHEFRGHGDDSGNLSLKINNDGNVGIGSTIPSNSYKFINQNSTNQVVQLTYNSNASFTQDAHAWDTNRSANSAFNFFRARTNVGGSPDSEMILTGEGNFNIDGTVTENGADYAEYFEWKDGNSDNEDRVGITVKLDGDKIVPSTSDDNASVIIGVISGKPSVVGDSAWNKWKNKHQTDDYGRYVWEEYTVTEWTIPATDTEEAVHHSYHTDYIPSDLTAPSDATVISKEEDGTNLMRRKLNSSYNPSTTYIPRSKRKEWDTVGLVGKLRITKGQKTGTNWIKMRDISENVEEWLVK